MILFSIHVFIYMQIFFRVDSQNLDYSLLHDHVITCQSLSQGHLLLLPSMSSESDGADLETK